jgi:hypothetical protein
MSDWTDHVLPHGPLVQLSPRVWQVTGSMKNMALPRNMTIWRMEGGGLWIHSAIALDDAGMAAVEALGRPEVLVVPSGYHRLDAAVWKARYPDIRVVCPEASRARVEQVVKVDSPDTEVLGVVAHRAEGLKEAEHIYEIDAGAGQALVVTDALFNLDPLPGFSGFVLGMIGSTGFFGMTRIARLALLQDARAYKGWLERTAGDPALALICVAHGNPVMADTALKLKAAAARL